MNSTAPGASWAQAVPALATLPRGHQESHGAANLMSAIKQRAAAKRFIEECLMPLISRGIKLTPVICYVDADVAAATGLSADPLFEEGMTRFEAGVFKRDDTGEQVRLAV